MHVFNNWITPVCADTIKDIVIGDERKTEYERKDLIVSQDDQDLCDMDHIDTDKPVHVRYIQSFRWLIRYHVIRSPQIKSRYRGAVESGSVCVCINDSTGRDATIRSVKKVIARDVGCDPNEISLSRQVEDKTELADTQSIRALRDGAHVNVRLID